MAHHQPGSHCWVLVVLIGAAVALALIAHTLRCDIRAGTT